jgi:hypothetical protein
MAGHGELTGEGREEEREEERGGGCHGEGCYGGTQWLLLYPWCSCGSCFLYVREGTKEKGEKKKRKEKKRKKRKKYEIFSKLENF